MKLNLYDKSLNRIAAIEDRFVSCLWAEGYNTMESFVLELQDTPQYRQKVRPGCFVGRSDRNTVMAITSVEVSDNKIIAGGHTAVRLLKDISFIGTITAGSQLFASIKSAIDGSGSKNPLLSVTGEEQGILTPLQISHKSALELCETLCQSTDLGFRVVRNGKLLELQFYKPEDSGKLIFSENYSNLSVDSVILSTENLKNYAIVLGEGEEDARIRVDVDETNGEQRLDLIVDAKDLSREEGETDTAYNERLTFRGKEKLLECRKTWECIFTPRASDFGSKFDLGDILTVMLPDMGLTLKARVSRFTQKEQNNQTKTTIEVGEITIQKG